MLEYSVSLYRTNLTNEIIFVAMPTPANPFGGQNENAAESRHQGAELTAAWHARRWLDFLFAYTYTDATFENGAYNGNEIPLVPKNRFSGSAEMGFPKGWSGRLAVLAVGDQVLSNDQANTEPRLASYVVVNARIDWRPGGASPGPRPSATHDFLGALELFIEGRNLLDEEYATRGITAFDFSTFSNQVYLTPAPPRSFVAGLSVVF